MPIIVSLNGGYEVQTALCKVPSTRLVKGYTLNKFHLFLLFIKMDHRNPKALGGK